MYDRYPFELKPLPYPYDALEPYIDEETMRLHHDKHLQAYVDNLNRALAPYPATHVLPLERLVTYYNRLPAAIREEVRNNAGGVYNHNMYFDAMKPGGGAPSGSLAAAISRDFGSFDQFKAALKAKALGRFGSGWGVLALNPSGRLVIASTPNQDTVLPMGLCPILPLDVWEHAYYLKYQNRRAEYIDNWFSVIDWAGAQGNYNRCLAARIKK